MSSTQLGPSVAISSIPAVRKTQNERAQDYLNPQFRSLTAFSPSLNISNELRQLFETPPDRHSRLGLRLRSSSDYFEDESGSSSGSGEATSSCLFFGGKSSGTESQSTARDWSYRESTSSVSPPDDFLWTTADGCKLQISFANLPPTALQKYLIRCESRDPVCQRRIELTRLRNR